MTDDGHPHEVGPLENALRMLRERWWVMAACIAVFSALFLGRALSTEKSYTATASVLLRPSSLATLIDPNGRAGADPERDAATNLLLVRSNDVAERVKRRLRSPLGVGDLISRVDVYNLVGADMLDVTATESTPDGAAQLANAFAEEFVGFRRDNDRVLIRSGEATLRGQLAALGPGDTVERRDLEQALQKVRALNAIATGDAEVVSSAEAPTQASAPLPKRSLATGIVLGAGIGFLLIVALQVADRRVRRVEDFELLYDRPVLASVPTSGPATLALDPEALEAYRILAGGLSRLAPDTRAVLVTSAAQGEGKTSVAVGLARAAALAGQRVVLVEADLRRPSLAGLIGQAGTPRGLVTALVGGASVSSLLVPMVRGLASLQALPAGPVPPNAPELLRSMSMRDTLAVLRATFDLVVIDAPALLPVADAQVLLDLPEVDACLVVARSGVAAEPEIARTRTTLERYADLPVGLVVTDDA